jgi:hypothetical protein
VRDTVKLGTLAFSPDSRFLAASHGGFDAALVSVWEMATRQEVCRFRGPYAVSLCFSPDARALASGGNDSTILLWDLTGRMMDGRLQTAQWSREDLEQRWKDLASDQGPRAVQAIWDLAAAPGQAVPMLRQRVRAAESPDAERVERLIRDLDSEAFEARTRATEELEKVVDGAEPLLRKTLAEKPSLEVRRRVRQVLSKLEPSASGERLRALRAVQVLEYAGTPEAKEYLRALAEGAAEARLTREAKAALERLAKAAAVKERGEAAP